MSTKKKKKRKKKKKGKRMRKKITDTEYIKAKVSEESFEKVNVIGTGHYSKVFLVRKKGKKEKYLAMKVMSKKKIVDGNDVENIKTERHLLTTYRHPFFVNLHYAFKSDTNLFFVMDFVPGGELFTHLKRERRFCERRTRMYAAEIFLALQFLHRNRIIYRDLKPENVLLDYDGHLRLCDFGLSKILTRRSSKTNTWCGTPEYLAPEILLDCEEDGYGIAIDWWAYGVLIYEMLVGITPFYNEDVNQMYENIIYDDVVFPRKMELSRATKDIIRKLLRRDPKSRLGTKSCLEIKNHPFFQWISWEKVSSKKIKPKFIPNLSGQGDTKYVDKEFLEIPVECVDNEYDAPLDSLENGSLGSSSENEVIFGGRKLEKVDLFSSFSYSASMGKSAGKDRNQVFVEMIRRDIEKQKDEEDITLDEMDEKDEKDEKE